MDRAIDPAAAEQGRVRRVHDRIHGETGNIAVLQDDAAPGAPDRGAPGIHRGAVSIS